MVVEQEKLLFILIYSVLLGLFFGFIYGIFKFRRLCIPLKVVNVKKTTQNFSIEDVVVFFEDVLFALFSAISICIFTYYMNAGRFRGIVLVGCLFGFVVYYNTIGKLVLRLSAILMRFVGLLLKKIFILTVLPLFRLFKFIFDSTFGWLIRWGYTVLRQSSDVYFAKMGFCIIRKKG